MINDKQKQTIATYNSMADEFAQKFDKTGVRTVDIDRLFNMVNIDNPLVVEIGCGAGRDAKYFLTRTCRYIGIDASSRLIDIAKQTNPSGKFISVRVEEYEFPKDTDVVYASASLIHVTKKDLMSILSRLQKKMTQGGIVYVYLKWAEKYTEITTDILGTRTYYLYSLDDIEDIKGDFKLNRSEIIDFQGQKWLEVILQKQSTLHVDKNENL